MSALTLKIIACGAMLIDHIGCLWGITAFRAVGRIAFPIFLFLICNGYRHTSSKSRYALRLGIFAVLSQVPFSLCFGYGLPMENGNVFFSLLLALLCIWAADSLHTHPVGRYFCLAPAMGVYAAFVFGLIRADNGVRAIILGAAFWLLDGKAWWKRLLIGAAMIFAVCNGFFLALVNNLLRGVLALPNLGFWQGMQLSALLSLPLIFAYNGEKGRTPATKWAAKALQLGFYGFYPVHLLLLWLIKG